jgi:hypothetical protein
MKLHAKQKESVKQLRETRLKLNQDSKRLKVELHSLQSRKQSLEKAIQLDEAILETRLQSALRKLKNTRPDLFQITLEEQLGKIAAELTGSLIRYLFE